MRPFPTMISLMPLSAAASSLCFVLLLAASPIRRASAASPFVPASDAQVLADLPSGARNAGGGLRSITSTRLDVALPLAQLDISRARTTGDLRFLGYADAILSSWMSRPDPDARVLVLKATVLQSRHEFDAALVDLDRALKARPDDPQAWLTRATVLRVLGRYAEAIASCEHLPVAAGSSITTLCEQSLRGLTGHLQSAYDAIASMSAQDLPREARAWRFSELGEMAERLGFDPDAERWFREGLQLAPDDFYMRTAYADLLLRNARPAEALTLLVGREAMEPMLLRIAIAHKQLRDGAGSEAESMLSSVFEVEQQRGDAVHRREQARFLLDVRQMPMEALTAAEENWKVQREPEDILILLRCAVATHQPQAAIPALQFVKEQALEDVRLRPFEHAT